MRLLKNDNSIIRVLKETEEDVFFIDCVKHTMPKWASKSEVVGYVECTEEELFDKTGVSKDRVLNMEEQKIARERFTMIAPVLPFIDDTKKRNDMMQELSKNISKQTIRKYLCLYLAYQGISVLAPAEKTERELTADEKNMRWGLNKFFYTKNKNSLKTAYAMMLKEKYCDASGQLLSEHPTFYQFRYYYRQHENKRQYYISRDGIKSYERNNRPLLGDGVQEYAANNVGMGFLDATVCDIYLVDDVGNLVGRPILTACVEAFSGMCLGYSLSWEGGVYSLRNLMVNTVTDKVKWCKEHGVFIEEKEWNAQQLPSTLVTDMGSEYISDTFSQIVDLGVKLVNLPPYRPDLKGPVEKFFDVIQTQFKKHLKGKGVIEPDYRERGAHDYRKDACLTMSDFEKVILHCIIYYNSKRIVENYPYTSEMIHHEVRPYASEIFEWGKQQLGANLLDVKANELIQVLLPRTTGKFTRKGLKVNGLRYKHLYYVEDYLNGREVVVAYNPEDVSEVWLIENGCYISFALIEARFKGKSIEAVVEMKKEKQQLVRSVGQENLQAQINLSEHIQVIANSTRHHDTKIKDIRTTRKKETERCHVDLMKEGVKFG